MAPEASPQPTWQRAYVVAAAAIIGGALAYALCDWGGWTRLQHDPYTGDWWWQDGPTQKVAINYYGSLLWALGGASVGALGASIALRVYRRELPSSLIMVIGAWALTGVALGGLYYVWMLWPF